MTRTRVFILTVLYLGGYGWLRVAGEIEHVAPSAGLGERHFVGAGWGIPRWRQQVYRTLYSPAMVAEEEARRVGHKRNAGRPAERVAGFGAEAPWSDSAGGQNAPVRRGAPTAPVPYYPAGSSPDDGKPVFAPPPAGGIEFSAAGAAGANDGETMYYFAPVSGMIPAAAVLRRAPSSKAPVVPSAPPAANAAADVGGEKAGGGATAPGGRP